MEVSTTLNVSAEYLFSRLVDTVVYDARKETGRSVSVDELENMSYRTHVDKQTRARILITKLVRNRSYHYRVETAQTVFSAGYDLVELAADKVRVTYTESLLQKDPVLRFKARAAERCLGWLRRHNFIRILKNFEVGY